jgi:hypothetical protein
MKQYKINEIVEFDVTDSEIVGRGRIMGKASGGLAEFWIVQILNRPNQYMKDLQETALCIQDCFLKAYDYDAGLLGQFERVSDEIETWPQWKKDIIKRERQT